MLEWMRSVVEVMVQITIFCAFLTVSIGMVALALFIVRATYEVLFERKN